MKKTIILVAILASALALGCADAEKQDEEIELRVNATVAAIPTQTPYPTHIPTLVSTPEPTPYPDQPATRNRTATITDDRTSAETDPYITNPSPYEYKPDPAYDGPAGIHVSGTGTATGIPDIAVISLGVEAHEKTAAMARTNAAQGMKRISSALAKAGVSPDDIQTTHFNIAPRYQGVEVEWCEDENPSIANDGAGASSQGCYSAWENRLTGYTVSNSATVKIRNVQDAGDVIDQVTAAAENLVRIHGIRFDIEDRTSLEDQARAEAVKDMQRKASFLAEEAGVALGPIIHINEGRTSLQKLQPEYGLAEAAMAASSAPTPISGGRMEVTVRVEGIHLIEHEE